MRSSSQVPLSARKTGASGQWVVPRRGWPVTVDGTVARPFAGLLRTKGVTNVRAQGDSRSGGRILVDQLQIQGVERLTCVPGESFLAVLDALHDASIDVVVCRQEG